MSMTKSNVKIYRRQRGKSVTEQAQIPLKKEHGFEDTEEVMIISRADFLDLFPECDTLKDLNRFLESIQTDENNIKIIQKKYETQILDLENQHAEDIENIKINYDKLVEDQKHEQVTILRQHEKQVKKLKSQIEVLDKTIIEKDKTINLLNSKVDTKDDELRTERAENARLLNQKELYKTKHDKTEKKHDKLKICYTTALTRIDELESRGFGYYFKKSLGLVKEKPELVELEQLGEPESENSN